MSLVLTACWCWLVVVLAVVVCVYQPGNGLIMNLNVSHPSQFVGAGCVVGQGGCPRGQANPGIRQTANLENCAQVHLIVPFLGVRTVGAVKNPNPIRW